VIVCSRSGTWVRAGTTLSEQPIVEVLAAQPLEVGQAEHRYAPIAAWWHSSMLLVVLVAGCLFELRRVAVLRAAGFPHRSAHYGIAVAAEWLVLAFVLLGIWLHGTSIEAVMGPRWKSIREVLKETGVALLFWAGSVVLLAILRALLAGLPNGPGVKFILPMGWHEMLGWIALSVSAGICEEAIFRGYLQRQFMAATQNVDAALVLTSIFFGLMHLY
jgi:CAAX protease family protein